MFVRTVAVDTNAPTGLIDSPVQGISLIIAGIAIFKMSAIGEEIVGLLGTSLLREIWDNLPEQAGPEQVYENVLINARDLLPEETGFYRYMGSLTTPPCSEGVNWYVMTQPIDVGVDQVSRFAQAVGANARPLQAMNHRLLLAPIAGE